MEIFKKVFLFSTGAATIAFDEAAKAVEGTIKRVKRLTEKANVDSFRERLKFVSNQK